MFLSTRLMQYFIVKIIAFDFFIHNTANLILDLISWPVYQFLLNADKCFAYLALPINNYK